MVISAPTVLSSSGTGADATVFNTAIIAPDPGALLVLFVDNGTPTAGENDTPTITDTIGLTWTLRDSATGYNGGFLKGSVWTAPAPDGDSGSIGIHFAHLQSGCHWHVIQVMGANIDNPVVQASHTIYNTTQNPTFNLASPPVSSSLVLGFAIRNSTTPFTAGTGHTLLSSQNGSSGPAIGSDVSYDLAPAGQAVGFTTASLSNKTLFGIEIGVGGALPPPVVPTTATLIRKWKDIDTLSTNTVVLTAPANLVVGQTLVISLSRVTGASPGTITSVTGIGTNVATVPPAAEAIRASTMIADTIVIPITQTIPSGTAMTINISGGTPSRKAFVASVWEGLTGEVNATSGTAGANGSTAAVSAVTTAAVTVTKVLVIGTVARGAVTYTPDAGNTLVDEIATAVGSTDRGVSQQYRIDSAAGTKTASGTLGSGSWAANVIALKLADSAAGTPVADAGGNVIDKEPGEPVDLSADGSTSGSAMTFVWQQLSGEPVDFTVSGPDLHIDEAPYTIAGTTLVFRVTVTSSGLSSSDDVSVTVLASEGRIKVKGVEVSLKTVQVA